MRGKNKNQRQRTEGKVRRGKRGEGRNLREEKYDNYPSVYRDFSPPHDVGEQGTRRFNSTPSLNIFPASLTNHIPFWVASINRRWHLTPALHRHWVETPPHIGGLARRSRYKGHARRNYSLIVHRLLINHDSNRALSLHMHGTYHEALTAEAIHFYMRNC